MGLDISFYRKKENTESIEVAYFRKHNWLLPFFNYRENLSDKIVTDEQLKDFISKAKEILEAPLNKRYELAKKTIPTEAGFFFGGTAYDVYYFEGLRKNIENFEKILEDTDFANESVIMNCWW